MRAGVCRCLWWSSQEELAENRAEIARLQAQNASLLDQVDFFRSLVGDSYRRTFTSTSPDGMDGATAVAPAQPVARVPLRHGAAAAGTGKFGMAVLAVVLACALCALPGMGPDGGVGGATSASGARGLMSNEHMVAPNTATPVLPSSVLWSPSAAITVAIQALGLQSLAHTVLSHLVALGIVALLLVATKRSNVLAPLLRMGERAGLPAR